MSTVGLVEAQRELTHSQKSRDPRPSTTVRSDAPCFFWRVQIISETKYSEMSSSFSLLDNISH